MTPAFFFPWEDICRENKGGGEEIMGKSELKMDKQQTKAAGEDK